jgi:hypothetical protein
MSGVWFDSGFDTDNMIHRFQPGEECSKKSVGIDLILAEQNHNMNLDGWRNGK